MYQNRTLIRGDNLTEMRQFPDECIDLIATDPPFNSKRDYFLPFRDEHGQEPDVLKKAFSDTWAWGDAAEEACEELIVNVGEQIGNTIEGLRQFLDETPMMAYLVMMAVRIVEIHRILKSTGSLYLHCDPTASHYLKIVLDAVFEHQNFRNEIVWHYPSMSRASNWFPKKNDIVFFYTKRNKYTFNADDEHVRVQYADSTKERAVYGGAGFTRKQGKANYLKSETKLADTVWKIPHVKSKIESLGYPTQKPIKLYKRIIAASSNKNDLILDPFCGCGTTLMAAEALDRQWIGIDLTYLATGAVKHQIEKYYPNLLNQITITGTPENEQQALELARTNPFNFEEWAVTHVLKFKANAKKVADGGIDGTMKFSIGRIQGKQAYGTAIAQVKGGNYTLGHIRDFRTAMRDAKADMGIFLVTTPPTPKMQAEAAKAKTYEHPSYEFTAPCLQIYQIQDYFNDKFTKLPHAEKSLL